MHELPHRDDSETDAAASLPLAWVGHALDERRRAGLLRLAGVRQCDPLRDFSSNDYLGLRHDRRLFEAGLAAAFESGGGAGSSPAVSGWTPAYDRLTQSLADWKRAEAALAFASGYAASVSTVAALVSNHDAVYADRLAHACLLDGVRIAGARLRVFPHNDADRLEQIIRRDAGRFRRRLIVTESLFSMDGDQAPLLAMAELAGRHRCMMIVDEAHASGVFGPEGQGLVEAAGLAGHPSIVRLGTLSKAIGCQGGYVVGSKDLILWLIQAGRCWIYSTALAPCLAGAATESIRIVRAADDRRESLMRHAELLRRLLHDHGWQVVPGAGPIVPVLIGPAAEATRIGETLARGGFAVGTIRPPTVPRDTARLRISVKATHGRDAIEGLVHALNLARQERSG